MALKSSSRGGTKVIWVAVHTAEGSRTVQSLYAYFAQASTQASSHAGIDDDELAQGPSWVPYDRAAWTLRNGNARSDNAEVCGFSSWSRAEWLRHGGMLALTAKWIAQRCRARGIPIVHLTAAQVGRNMPGVIGHVDYTRGTGDGTHTDPGPNFPWDVVIARAREINDPTEDDDMPTPAEVWSYENGDEPDMHAQLVQAAKDAERAKAIATQNQVEIRAVAKAVADLTELVRTSTTPTG